VNTVWGQAAADTAKNSGNNPSASAPVHPLIYFSKQEVDANFEHHKGMDETLYASDYGTRSFEVKTSRRVKTLAAEVHITYTDILYIVKGSATLVTGGKLVDDITPLTYPDGRPFDETKMARSIVGGESRHIAAGDVVIIPNGLPHWFTEVEGPFWFFNVKSR
jgi:mannose-6-phosphate isomerase-like protein (cupin superfamily)